MLLWLGRSLEFWVGFTFFLKLQTYNIQIMLSQIRLVWPQKNNKVTSSLTVWFQWGQGILILINRWSANRQIQTLEHWFINGWICFFASLLWYVFAFDSHFCCWNGIIIPELCFFFFSSRNTLTYLTIPVNPF